MMPSSIRNLRMDLLVLLCLIAVQAFGQGSNAEVVERYAEEGQQALAEGHLAQAEQAFQKLAELEPGVAEVHANLGLIYFQEGKFDLAIPALRRALKLKPSLTKTESLLAVALSEVGQFKEALPGLEKSFRHSQDPETKRMSGLQLERAYTALQQDRKAVEVALEMDHLYSDDAEVLYHNSKIYGYAAYLTIEKLVKVAPSSEWRHLAAAEAQESQGAYAAAIGEYRQVLAIAPDRPGIHYRLGRTLLLRADQAKSAEDTAEAIREFQLELKLDPSNANAAYEIGEVDRKAGKFDDAVESFQTALEHYPDFEEAHVGLAGALQAQQKPQEALRHLQRAIQLNPEDEVAWYRMAQVQKALGNGAEQQKALVEFRRLHQKVTEQNGLEPAAPREVTKQEVDTAQPQ